jgi:large conductance mechanosensitive channel
LPLDLAQKAGPVLAWGDFLTTTLNFVIVAFCIFLMIKLMNKLVKKEEAVAPPTPTEQLLTEIRDLLKNRS